MTNNQLKSIIRNVLLEIKKDDDLPPVDPDIEGLPYGEPGKEIWPGSDIGGIKQHGTGMPHGMGYPNWDFRHRMTLKDLQKILSIHYIYQPSEQAEEKASKEQQKETIEFIKRNMPWVFNFRLKDLHYQITIGHNEYYYPFNGYFDYDNNWLNFGTELSQHVMTYLGYAEHEKSLTPEELMKPPGPYETDHRKYHDYWQQAFREFPTMIPDLKKLLVFLNNLQNNFPTNPKNSRNYPIYVSLYDTSRRLGGHEEGGWWYDANEHITSIKVNSYQEMRKAIVTLLRTMSQADLNGKPWILLEKEEGSQDSRHQPPPTYS